LQDQFKETEQLAEALYQAEQTRKGISPLTERFPDLSIEAAYQIQLTNIRRKVNEGQTIVGKKIGLTSKAMQELLGVNQPDYGHLLDSMVVENGGEVPQTKVLQPRVEGEIAFILKKDLQGPGVTVTDVLRATDYVVAAIEIVDSRIKDWKIKLADTIADNASSGLYVLGTRPVKIDRLDLAQLGMVLYKNGEVMNTGVGAAALGHPALCVAWLANQLAQFDTVLKAGEVILSGALSAAVNAEPGDHFSVRFDQLGEVSVKF
jgi:2-keto-4-pentenoate hydratase